jgi:hypothetical protein
MQTPTLNRRDALHLLNVINTFDPIHYAIEPEIAAKLQRIAEAPSPPKCPDSDICRIKNCLTPPNEYAICGGHR